MAIIKTDNIDYISDRKIFKPTTFYAIEESSIDIYFRVTEGTRLDVIADKVYRDAGLWWVIASVNNLDLIDYCISSEKIIRVPHPSRLPRILSELRNAQ